MANFATISAIYFAKITKFSQFVHFSKKICTFVVVNSYTTKDIFLYFGGVIP